MFDPTKRIGPSSNFKQVLTEAAMSPAEKLRAQFGNAATLAGLQTPNRRRPKVKDMSFFKAQTEKQYSSRVTTSKQKKGARRGTMNQTHETT